MNPKLKKRLENLATIIFFGLFIFWYGYMEREDAPYFVFAKSFVTTNSQLENKLGNSWKIGDFESVTLRNGEPEVTFDIIGSPFIECIRLQLEETKETDYRVVSVHAGKKGNLMGPKGPTCYFGELARVEF
ncbi:hypothetical protein MWU49_17155 [Alcanivorax sp. S6407]|uniref:hypothetical protein n=1 Tax=Alcanivorax sp. S6407 TaxID=2926424 RepID=UPI001FF41737|nr:hypothetical protein [Alcanivorax sp. S6407]MCK0155447.1 hypothetical protein [Alcanivorax sp. S6407]